MLGKDLGDKSYAVVCKENSHKIRKPTSIDPNFAKAGHDLVKTYKSCGTVIFTPKSPEKWHILMTQLTKDNKDGACRTRPRPVAWRGESLFLTLRKGIDFLNKGCYTTKDE